jgi:hypothetical protein
MLQLPLLKAQKMMGNRAKAVDLTVVNRCGHQQLNLEYKRCLAQWRCATVQSELTGLQGQAELKKCL